MIHKYNKSTFKILNGQYDSQKRINQPFKYYIDNMRGGWSHPLWQKKNKIKWTTWKEKENFFKKRKENVFKERDHIFHGNSFF